MGRSSAPPSTESLSKGTIVHSQAQAIRELWGEDGLRDVVGRLPTEAAEATAGVDFEPLRWYPTRYLLDWNVALLDGPARQDEQAFRRCVARSIDLGFGRVRRAFLAFATPDRLAQRASELWRHEHSQGELSIESDAAPVERTARLALRDHPFITTALSRLATAEVFRYILSLSRARNVRESHALHGDALRITLRWEA
jgi:hypothetical protein